MAPTSVCAMVLVTALLGFGPPSKSQEYKPAEFLGLDLSHAVLSSKALGPPAHFVPVPTEARIDQASSSVGMPVVRSGSVEAVVKSSDGGIVHRHARKPTSAPVRLARQRRNPLDAQAADTRIQVWPCRSGGICNWQR